MKEQMKKFMEEVSKDKGLQLELVKDTKQNLAEIAKRRGYDLKPEDFDADQELSAEELNAVAGGAVCGCFFLGGGNGEVNCGVMGGFGIGDSNCDCCIVGVA
jgi:predicted ribosomally synthesized peptide with nif11-like leader